MVNFHLQSKFGAVSHEFRERTRSELRYLHLERVLFHTFQLTAPNKLGRKKIGPPNDIQKREKR